MSLDKGLKRLEGVTKTQLTTIKPVHLDVTLKPGVWIDPDKFVKQIAEAGYEARKEDIRLTVTGKITKDGDRVLITVDDVKPEPVTLLLAAATGKDKKEAESSAGAYREVIEQVGKVVEITGWWKAANKKDKSATPTLSVIRLGDARQRAAIGKE